MNDTSSTARGVQSIEVGSKLLAVLVEEAEPMMLKDIARQAGIAAAQAHAYLVSYRKIGLVEQDGSAGRYRLGPFALELAVTRMRTFDAYRAANQAVIELSAKTGLNVALVVWGSFGPTVIQVQESGSQLNMNTRVGTVYSLTGTASGRAFAAFMPDDLVKSMMRLERREDYLSAKVGRPAFMSRSEIEGIRGKGYATIDDPPVPGINAISAPVFDQDGQMQFALTIIGQATALQDVPNSPFIPVLLETTAELSAQLGYYRFRVQP
jgi:DNA-binding IclR family transcriptional regulator